MKELLGILLSPPALPMLCIALGFGLHRRWRRLSLVVGASGFALLWLLSTPFVAGTLLRTLEGTPPLPVAADGDWGAGAIVILSAELDGGPEYGGATAGRVTLQRLRYGAELHRRTGLPILCSGGGGGGDRPALAAAMADTLDDFGAAATFLEDRSRDTWENAWFSARLLRKADITRVLLVTSAFHIPRARAAFEAAGLEVVAAPTGLRGPPWEGVRSLLPDHRGMRDSAWFVHEVLGRVADAWRSPPDPGF